MAKKTRRSTKSFINSYIFISIIIILIILNILIFIITYYHNQRLIQLNNEIKDKYLVFEEVKQNYDDIHNKLSLANSIDNKTNLIKQEFFKKAKMLEDKILAGTSDKKIAYLTFDDGPYYLTYEFLNVLDEYDVLATFFTIGLNKDNCYDYRGQDCSGIYALEASKGHTMANHTYSHAIFKGLYYSADSFIDQVKLQENLLMTRTGVKPNIVRFPGGSPTAGSLKYDIINRLRALGYGWVDWTASIGDGGRLTDYYVGWNNFVNAIDSNIEVILMHDYNKITLQLLPKEIEYLKNNGYLIFPLFYESNMVNK